MATDNLDPVQKDTLVIIGNGFDIWQRLDTSYDRFEEYYYAHLDEILKALHIKKRTLLNEDRKPVLNDKGEPILYSDVELFYGDPYKPGRLPHDFWHTFEASLDKMDDQQLNLFFGKDPSGLKGIKRGVRNALRILEKTFCDWVATINIDQLEPGYRFGDNCLFINFNYTDTLLKRFGIKEEDEIHIHGEAYDKKSIIFGHSTHPELPLRELYHHGGRLRGLYFVEEALYLTDKHVEDNYQTLRMFFALHGLQARNIKHIYVLGHSFGPADLDYFNHLVSATQGTDEFPAIELTAKEQNYLDNTDADDEYFLNFQYAVHHRERMLKKKPISYPDLEKIDEFMYRVLDNPYYRMTTEEQFRVEKAAVHKRFMREQAARNAQAEKEFLKMLRRVKSGTVQHTYEVPSARQAGRTAADIPDYSVQWHISYHSSDDKQRIESAMQKFQCQKYILYPTIDQCLAPFKL